jgi:NADH-quinone oxidoreductase subunit M
MGIPNVGVLKSDEDLHRYELWAIIPLIILMIIIGLFPNILLSLIHQTTKMLVR